jgi:hypothetical protein
VMSKRPDIKNRIRNLNLVDNDRWPRPYVSAKELSNFFRNASPDDVLYELQSLSKRSSPYEAFFYRIDKSKVGKKGRTINLPPKEWKFYFSRWYPPSSKSKESKVTLCPKCNKPIPGRHARKRRGHDPAKCDVDMTEFILDI